MRFWSAILDMSDLLDPWMLTPAFKNWSPPYDLVDIDKAISLLSDLDFVLITIFTKTIMILHCLER